MRLGVAPGLETLLALTWLNQLKTVCLQASMSGSNY